MVSNIYLSFLEAKNFHETLFFKYKLEIFLRAFVWREKFREANI